MKIESFVFDFDGTLAVLRLDFAEMKRRLSTLARSYFAPPPPRPFLPVLEWLDWLDRSIPKNGEAAVSGVPAGRGSGPDL